MTSPVPHQEASSTLKSRDSHCQSAAWRQKCTNGLPYLFEDREAFSPGEARLRCGTSSLHPPWWEEIFGTLSVKGENCHTGSEMYQKEGLNVCATERSLPLQPRAVKLSLQPPPGQGRLLPGQLLRVAEALSNS